MIDAPVVDAHHHFWINPTPQTYPWMTGDLAALRRSFGPEDLRPLLEAKGVRSTVAVQSRSSLDESRELLEIADEHDFVAGVVAWVDLTSPDVGEQIRELRGSAGGHHLVGIRHQVHDEPDPQWLLRPDVKRGLEAVMNAGLVYELLVKEAQLPAALVTVRAFPELSFVIDHIAKPKIREGPRDAGWEAGLAPFSDLANVACKLSGMATEADWDRWQVRDLEPYFQRVAGWFGAGRLLFGSDWPVCTLAADYGRVFEAAKELVADLPSEARRGIFAANAIRIYRLEGPRR